jgi:hypothetical protein
MQLWGSFSLRKDESNKMAIGEIDIAPLISHRNMLVVGKLLVDHTVGNEIIKTPLIRAWQPSGRVTFKTLGTSRFLIEFEFEWDKIRILEG